MPSWPRSRAYARRTPSRKSAPSSAPRTASTRWLPAKDLARPLSRNRRGAVAERRQDEAERESPERHFVGQRARLEVGGRENHAGRREKARRGRDERGSVEESCREEEQRHEQLDERVANRDGRAAAATAATEKQPGHDRHVVEERDRRPAGGAARARVDDRKPARQPVDAHVREGAHDRARREEEAQEDAVDGVHERLVPARTRPASMTSDAIETAAPARKATGR